MQDQLNLKQINYIFNLLKDKINIANIKNIEIKELLKKAESTNFASSDILDITSILTNNFSTNEKKSDGITFTPIPLIKYMYTDVLSLDINYITKYRVADLAVGNGAFFIGLILILKEKFPEISIVDLIEKNLFGYDIKKENVFFTKLNLYVIALYFGENPENINFNINHCDTLKFFKNNNNKEKFDLIVGNPPYVKQQNIEIGYRNFLLDNFTTIKSNYNLYYAFLELSIELLNEDGISLQLVPNYLLKIKSALTLREYLLGSNHIKKIVNFNANKLFEGIDTYSMIIELNANTDQIAYKSLPNNESSLSYLSKINWKNLSPTNITHDSINLVDDKEEELVNKVQSQLYSLDISTGIATQKDSLFLIDDSNLFENKYYTKIFNNKEFLIEKESTIKIYKGSGQTRGNLKYSIIIYPYLTNGNIVNIKEKGYLLEHEPKTFQYFNEAKNEMLQRSGLKPNEEHWYKYGRTQALNRFETKIIFPTNSIKPNFNLITDHALFFNGYAIYGLKGKVMNDSEFKSLEIILNSKLIEIFMLCTSYFIGSGYVSYQKKYIEKVTIPILETSDIQKLIELEENGDAYNLNKFIFSIYNLEYDDFV